MLSAPQFCMLLFFVSPCLSSLHLFAENAQLTTANKDIIRNTLAILFAAIHTELSYYVGSGFTKSIPSDDSTITVTLFFYPRSLCGLTLNSTGFLSATGKDLRAGFNKTFTQLDELVVKSYNTGYVVYGQFLAGYYVVQGTNTPSGCVSLNNMTVDDGAGYCYGFHGMLLSGSPFSALYAGCVPLQSPDNKYELRIDNCNLAVTETATNKTIWTPDVLVRKQPNCYLLLQLDWNMVLYNSTSRVYPQWSSATYRGTGIKTTGVIWLELGEKGILTMYLSSGVGGAQSIWSSDPNNNVSTIFGDAVGSPRSSITQQSMPNPDPESSPNSKLKVSGIALIAILTCGLISLITIVLLQRKRLRFFSDEPKTFENKLERYAFSTLSDATLQFNVANKLGQGGSAIVYKGTIQGTGSVAIKFLQLRSHSISNDEFINEVSTISYLQHRNLIKLHGFCCEDQHRLLVYEFLENNSLSEALLSVGPNKPLVPWAKRYNICVGVARGIAYLHEESRIRIVHRDIKASNILLDKDLNATVSDFGLARLFKDGETHLSTRVAGTFGYLAPEYALKGKLTEKADVYSFGILLLEVLSGRRGIDLNLPTNQSFLLEWAWELYEDGQWLELVDKKLVPDTCPTEELQRVLIVSLMCTQGDPSVRPAMSRVVAMLLGDITLTPNISRPGFLPDLKEAALSKVDMQTTT